jgi:hypothetical protein
MKPHHHRRRDGYVSLIVRYMPAESHVSHLCWLPETYGGNLMHAGCMKSTGLLLRAALGACSLLDECRDVDSRVKPLDEVCRHGTYGRWWWAALKSVSTGSFGAVREDNSRAELKYPR